MKEWFRKHYEKVLITIGILTAIALFIVTGYTMGQNNIPPFEIPQVTPDYQEYNIAGSLEYKHVVSVQFETQAEAIQFYNFLLGGDVDD